MGNRSANLFHLRHLSSTLGFHSLSTMQLSRLSKTSDPLGRYYTNVQVGALLVRAMQLPQPGMVVDLGAGDGILVGEAAKVWPNANFITVDIDHQAGSAALPQLRGAAFRHYVGDVLDVKLASKVGLPWGEADAALCNPPYVRPKWEKQFAEILEDAGLSHVLPRLSDIPADLLFIAQNLRFLRSGGRLGLILPDGIVAGEKFAAFRKTLTSQHQVERVIELPRRIFKHTEAKAHIVIVAKHGQGSNQIEFTRLEQNGLLSKPLYLASERNGGRLDYSFLAQISQPISQQISHTVTPRKIRDVAMSVTRGVYSSIVRKSLPFPVFHTTDFSNQQAWVGNGYKLHRDQATQVASVNPGSIAQTGDILIARVGRNLNQKVCMVRSGKVVISDCIFRLRVASAYQKPLLAFLRSEAGQAALAAVTHGVGAQFITTNALLDLSF